ncbi:DUF7059 domain-containing protein [Propionicicella superfundia]|uniref:DUF7059 domain-containing protein n=1 Tax=Propionicicella superfundia TaxID=348582 RepID=UPI000417D364|nr:methyltransferase [Propionicicella superfundia]
MENAQALADALLTAEFTWDGVAARIGEPGLSGLARNSTIPAADTVGDDALGTLVRLWALGATVPRAAADAALPGLVPSLVRAGLLAIPDDGVRARVEIKPYATDTGWSGWVCSDLTPGLDGGPTRPRPDHVLGVSPASTSLAQLTIPDHVGAALDLGTGSGVQLLHLAPHANRLVGTDLNPRALALARITLALNGVAAELREGDLYSPVADEAFDLIVTNPPFVISPPSPERLTYREGILPGDELVRRVVVDGADRLAPGGTLQVLANWAVTAEPWEERLAGWVRPTGCDALIVERERLDVYAYIEIWLSDAGLDGSPEYRARYREWLDYFSALGVTAVGMGWLNLRRTGVDEPVVRVESWPHLVHQPVGPAISASFAQARTAREDPATLLGRRWIVPADVQQETLGHPAAADPEAIVLRSTTGFGRASRLDTATAAFVSASDGDLTAGQLAAAIADLLDVPTAELVADLLPRLRDLAADGLIVPARTPVQA